MKAKKIFTPFIAIGLAMSLSVGADLNINPWHTQIENFHIEQFSDAVNAIDQYFYKSQSGTTVLLKSLTFSFADRPTPSQLTLQNDTQNNGTIALDGANTVIFEDYAGLWIDGFSIDFSRSDISQAKQIHLSFGNGYISSFSAYNGKSSFSVKNGQNQDDIMTVNFSGEVNSDFLIDSKSSNTFTFNKSEFTTNKITGDITIRADNQNNSKNTFNFNNVTYTGTFTNAISTDTVINLDGSNTQFIGDINTTGGNTTVNFLTSGVSFQGNITADGGNNTLNFSETNTQFIGDINTIGGNTTINFLASEVNFQGNITADGGKNIFNLSSNRPFFNTKKIEASNYGSNVFNPTNGHFDLYYSTNNGATLNSTIFAGDPTGKNILNIAPKTSIEWNGAAFIDLPLITQSGNTEINIGDSAEFVLYHSVPIVTQGGTTTIRFLGSSGTIKGWGQLFIEANGGNNIISFEKDGTFNIDNANFTATNGINRFVIDKNIVLESNLTLYGNEVSEDGGNIVNLGANQTLTLSSNINGATIANSITTASGATYLNLKGDNAILEGNISTSGGKTFIDFQGDSQISGALNISSSGEANITVTDGKTASFVKPIEINGNNASLFVNLGNDSMIRLNGGSGNLSTTSGDTTLSFNGNGNFSGNIATSSGSSTTFELGKTDGSLNSATINIVGVITNSNNNLATNTIAGENVFGVNATNTTFKYTSQTNGLVFSHGQNVILFENNNNATLHWQGADSTDKSISTIDGNTLIEFQQHGTIASGLDTSGGEMTINLYEGRQGIINGEITTIGKGKSHVVFNNNNSTLILKDNATLTSVSNLENRSKTYGSNNGISFYHDQRSGKDFKTLTIGTKNSSSNGISGEGLNFVVYATTNETNTKANNPAYSDKVVIHSSSNAGSSTHNLGVKFENQDTIDLGAITYTKGGNNNILVASVAKSSKVSFNTQESLVLGFDVANVQYAKEDTDENGNIQTNGTYTSYFIGSAKVNDIVVAEQEITATAFTLNYDLYMANFNSLNKRMGELRENPHSQGVWTRVFNGGLSNDFGLGSKSNYTTIQAGYDYAFGGEGANNYLGVALSYALSTSASNNAYDINGEKRSIEGIYSNAFEVAVYNSYVSDIGWYNDTIAKFSYLLSNFDIKNLNNGESTSNDTHNFALTLSDEVGYQFALGGNNEWSIAPQLELGFGYFNQSDFKQTLQNSGAYLSSSADAILTLRARAGSSFGYDFKNFTQESSFNASVYAGVFYEYDYLSGGEIQMQTQRGTQTNQYSNLTSDGRVVMNVGTNMSVGNHTRIYLDFEKSFMGKINTDYQVNFGVRYSFGESNGYIPFKQTSKTQEESKAPLKD